MKKLFFYILLLSAISYSCNLVPQKQPREELGEVHREFYPSGKLKSVCQVTENKRNGICKYYNEKGTLMGSAEFKMNKHHGKSINYYQNGKIETEVEFADNRRNGLAKTYYTDGKLSIEENYVDGQLDGSKKKYYKSGQLMMENEFKEGQPSKNLKEYDEKGNLLIDTPTIVVQAIDRVALENSYILKFSLSSKSQRVKFYLGELKEGKFMPLYAEEVNTKSGVGTYEIPVYRGTTIMKELHIIAKKTSKLNNTQLITGTYNLAVKY